MRYIINGPSVAQGDIRVSGAKNFSIKALAASILNDGITEFHNLPDNLDVHKTIGMLKYLGVNVVFDDSKKCEISTKNIKNVLDDNSNANMIIFLLGAALIHKFDTVRIPKNKGCSLGRRADDFHIMSFEKFGVTCIENDDHYLLEKINNNSSKSSLKGAYIDLPYSSVGATETALFLAVYAEGMSVINNAAIEPEVGALITALNSMGAAIFFESDRKIIIRGVPRINKHVRIDIHGDLLEAATWGILAAVTQGEITVSGFIPELMGSFFGIFNLMGGKFERVGMDSVKFSRNLEFEGGNVLLETGVFPALRTDLQPMLAALATVNNSTTVIHETVYDKRIDYIEAFKKFGVKAEQFYDCFGNECRFHNKHLHSAVINSAHDIDAPAEPIDAGTIRNGMAQIILACAANGKTVIENIEIVERGYCSLFDKLKSVGIDVLRD